MKPLALLPMLLGAVAFAQAPQETFLTDIPLETGPVDGGWSALTLTVEPMPGTAATPLFLKRRGLRASDGGVVLRALEAPAPKDAPKPRHSGASWVIDFQEKAFTPVWTELEEKAGRAPTAPALTEFARAYIARKTMTRGFDLASNVAQTREGDCSEHAVFLAALLRHQRIPARVLLGVVLVNLKGTPRAFGHAWVEAWVAGAWKTVDAAIPAEANALYLPVDELADEGPGFAVGLLPLVQGLRFQRLALAPR